MQSSRSWQPVEKGDRTFQASENRNASDSARGPVPFFNRLLARRHLDDEIHSIILGLPRRHPGLIVFQVTPAERAASAMRNKAHFFLRIQDLHLHKALEEGRLVVIEGCRQDVAG